MHQKLRLVFWPFRFRSRFKQCDGRIMYASYLTWICWQKTVCGQILQMTVDTQSIIIRDNKEKALEITMKWANSVSFFVSNNLVNNADKAAIYQVKLEAFKHYSTTWSEWFIVSEWSNVNIQRLREKIRMMSVNQVTVYHTILEVYNIMHSI